ncbi:hypothetical protein EV363DRAFT_1162362, partial [Boletus edulis]
LVLNSFYLGLLITAFLLSLGNRTQGAKWAYTLALLGFALIMVYMTVRFTCFTPVELVLTRIEDLMPSSETSSLALVATLGLYIVSSLLSFDPWHMITSFQLYFLMASS